MPACTMSLNDDFGDNRSLAGTTGLSIVAGGGNLTADDCLARLRLDPSLGSLGCENHLLTTATRCVGWLHTVHDCFREHKIS
jgi:hypothetical protein